MNSIHFSLMQIDYFVTIAVAQMAAAALARNIARVRQHITEFPTMAGFNRIPGNCKIVSVEEGRVRVEMDVTANQLNPVGTLHGGCTATLADIFTTMALIATPRGLPGVSVDLHCSYLSAAKEGETIIIDSQVIKSGRSMAFTRAEFLKKSDNSPIAVCLHTKAIVEPKKKQEEETK
uniref:Acyl-coenzyme A thioesterase 13 n=1 Tax=Steinernema glaseri TaxID=37863 RepID=A0A1I7YNU3_9BILA